MDEISYGVCSYNAQYDSLANVQILLVGIVESVLSPLVVHVPSAAQGAHLLSFESYGLRAHFYDSAEHVGNS